MRGGIILGASLVLVACAASHESASVTGPTTPGVSFGGIGDPAVTTAHVRLHTALPAGTWRTQLLSVLEASARRFESWVPTARKPTIDVYLFEDESEWQRAVSTRLPAGVHLGRGMRRGAATIGGSSYLFDIGGPDALRLAAHEAWHAWAQRGLRSRLPLWLDEALACRAEGMYVDPHGGGPIFRPGANPTRRAHLRRLIRTGQLGTLEEHLRADPASLTDQVGALDDYYARAWALAMLLDQTDLSERLSGALVRAGRGSLLVSEEAPMASVLGIPAAKLDLRWRRLARVLTKP